MPRPSFEREGIEAEIDRLGVVLGISAIRISFEPCVRFARDPILGFFLGLEAAKLKRRYIVEYDLHVPK